MKAVRLRSGTEWKKDTMMKVFGSADTNSWRVDIKLWHETVIQRKFKTSKNSVLCHCGSRSCFSDLGESSAECCFRRGHRGQGSLSGPESNHKRCCCPIINYPALHTIASIEFTVVGNNYADQTMPILTALFRVAEGFPCHAMYFTLLQPHRVMMRPAYLVLGGHSTLADEQAHDARSVGCRSYHFL